MKKLLALVIALGISLFGLVPVANANVNPNSMILEIDIPGDPGTAVSADVGRFGLSLRGAMNVVVDWGDGNTETFDDGGTQNLSGYKPHVYTNAGTYQVSLTGSLEHFGFAITGLPPNTSDGAGGNAVDEQGKITGVVQWGNLGLNSLQGAFSHASNLISIPATGFPATVTNLRATFNQATSFNDPNISSWNVSNVTDFRGMFSQATSFNQPLLYNAATNAWNTGSATQMDNMFFAATNFDGAIGNWDTSNVISMESMFQQATKFNQPIGDWNVSNVTNMQRLFYLATNFNQPIGDWITSSVTNMTSTFHWAEKFNQPLGGWTTTNVQSMTSMFDSAKAFNQPIGNWDTSNVTRMNLMFWDASTFNQPLNGWDTSSVTQFEDMFRFAYSFNQPVGHFDFSAVDPTKSDLSLDLSGIDIQNLSQSIVDWAARTQPNGVNQIVPDYIERSALDDLRVLVDNYNWDIYTSAPANTRGITTPSRTHLTGFSGLRAHFDGGTLDDVRLGNQTNALDRFGELVLLDPANPTTNYVRLLNNDYASCDFEMDGVSVAESSITQGDHFKMACRSFPQSLAGGEVVVDIAAEVVGSFIRYTVEVVSVTGAITNLEVRFGGDLGSVSGDAKLEIPQGKRQLIGYQQAEFNKPIVTFELDRDFVEIRSGFSTQTITALTGDDDIYFDFGSVAIVAGEKLLTVEMAFIDFYPDVFSYQQAVEMARQVLAQQGQIFGMCLPLVRDGLVPDLIDECVEHPDLPTPINFANRDSDGEFEDVGEPSLVGDELVFPSAAVLNGQPVNAIVRIDNLSDTVNNELQDLDESGDSALADWSEWYLRVDLDSAPSATDARAELTIRFEDQVGNPVLMPELFLHAYDLDLNQYLELPGFQEYFLDPNTNLNVREADSGWTRFEDLTGVDSLTSTPDPRTVARVTVRYENVSQVKLVVGNPVANSIANFYFDLSAGLGWQSQTNLTGEVPEGIANFVDLPVFVAPTPNRVTEFSSRSASTCTPTTITLTGEKLNTVSAEIDGKEVAIIESSASKVVIEIPAGLTAGQTYDLILFGPEGRLSIQQAITVSSDICYQAQSPKAWTKKISDTEVKFYARDLLQAGKLQFMANGEEVAWINPVDESDPKLSFARNTNYFVRSFELQPGKNALEVYLNGERIWRAAYTGK